MPAVDTNAATDFLQKWKPGGPWILCAFHESDRELPARAFDADTVHELPGWLDDLQRRGFNVYFHVNPCRPGLNKKAEKADVVAMEWLHVDVDPQKGKPIAEEQTRIRHLLEKVGDLGLPEPSVVTFSGGGYQAFWKLAEPIPLGTPEAVADAERFNVQIAKLLGADNCHNVDRIMRLPGTVNFPDKKKRDRGQVPVRADVVRADWQLHQRLMFVQAPERQDQSAGISGGANRPEVNIPSGNIRRVPIDELQATLAQYGFREEDPIMRYILDGEDTEKTLMPGKDPSRSAFFLHVVCELVRHEMPDDLIYAIVTDPSYAISGHPRSKGRGMDRAVKRAIQRGKEDEIDPHLGPMNATYALVESVGGKCKIMCERVNEATGRLEIEFHEKAGFLSTHNNKTVDVIEGTDKNGNPQMKQKRKGLWWIEHANRRTYDGVTFYPQREFTNLLNLWRGFNVDAVPGDCSMFLQHVHETLCRGNDEHYEYLLSWMANAVQNPHLPGQVAVVLRGGQGTGKSTFAHGFGKLFGMHYKAVNDAEHILGRFNDMLRDAVLVFADECFAAADKKQRGALKALITESTLRTESKGLANVETRNCVHLIMATNNEWAVAAEGDDRRFFVLNVSDKYKQNSKHFDAIERQMEAGGYEALMHMLLTRDLSGFNVRACPKTDELQRQRDNTMEGQLEGFVLECLEEGELLPGHGWRGEALKDEWMEALHTYMGHNRLKKTSVTRFLREFLGPHFASKEQSRSKAKFKWRSKNGDKLCSYFFRFPSLDVCRKLWDEKFGARDWPPVDSSAEPTAYEPEPF